MNAIYTEFKERVVTTFRFMKFEFDKRPDELSIPIYQQEKVIARLRPVHAHFTSQEVNLLMEWRNQNREAFLTWVTPTEESTRKWLTEQIHQREDRILFFAETLDGIPFGQIGLTNFDFILKACEIDNVLRGEANLIKGGMTFVLRALMDWVFCFLKATFAYLRVFSDNERAISLYMRNGLLMVKRLPLRRIEEGNIVRWVEVEEEPGAVFEKFLAYLKIDWDDYRRLN